MKKIYYLLTILLGIFACTKSNPNERPFPEEIMSNDVTISGIKDDDYIVAMNGKLLISPIITRENEQTESDLEFEWMIDNKIVSKSRNLDITLPNNISNGTKKGRYNVRNLKFNKLYSKDFNVTVTNPFGYGYYFISVNSTGQSLLSHINIDNNSETVFHTSVVGSADIGDNVHSLNSYPVFNKETNKLTYRISITSEKGVTPHIVTENTSLTLLETISSNHNGILFSPEIHVLGYNYEKTSHFISKNTYMLYENSVLIPKKNNYRFSTVLPGNNDKYLYTYDLTQGKFYIIDTENSYTTTELSGNLSSEKIIGHKLRNYYDNGQVKEEVIIMTARDKKISLYRIADFKITFINVVDVSNIVSDAIPIDETTWRIGAGNFLYSYDEQQKSLTLYSTLDKNLGDIEQIALAKRDGTLIVTTYNKSNSVANGSIIILKEDKTTTTYKNAIYRCTGITCCDATKWM